MNRIIKFRAWDKDESKMILPTDTDSMDYWDGVTGTNIEIINRTLNSKFYEYMQYTGLKDKNGKEIYEGDVIYLAGYGDYEVEFPFIELYEAYPEGDIGEIKGNIYENPNLLTK